MGGGRYDPLVRQPLLAPALVGIPSRPGVDFHPVMRLSWGREGILGPARFFPSIRVAATRSVPAPGHDTTMSARDEAARIRVGDLRTLTGAHI